MQLLGLDYLIDADLQPWLLEVNGTPSLAVEHSSPEVEALIAKQKVSAYLGCVLQVMRCMSWVHARNNAIRIWGARYVV